MKTKSAWIVAGIAALLSVGVAWAAKKEIVLTAAEDLKWTEVPESHGAQISPVTGDPMKTAYAAFAKIPAGTTHPLHTHTNEVKAVVISGTFWITPEGGVEKKLGPGSYFSVPGKIKHTSGCMAGAPCVLFQQGPAKFDMKPVGEMPAKAGEAPAKAGAAAAPKK